ncbi:MAG: YdcF family protein, partial [Rhodospirillaceae bacterium]|nr:YdcF family protein [Rhodospirillaceae bacterium]
MAFVLSKLLWPLAAPGNLALLLLVAGTALLFTRW